MEYKAIETFLEKVQQIPSTDPIHDTLGKETMNHIYLYIQHIAFSIHINSLAGGSDGKASASNAGDLGSIPRSERSPGEGNGNTIQYSCLENTMDRGAWQATYSP